MQTSLVFLALIVLPSKLQNFSIVQPEKRADHDIEEPCDNNVGPLCIRPNVSRSNLGQPVVLRDGSASPIDRDQDAAAEERENQEDIATHSRKSHEYCRIHPDQAHHILLRCRPQRRHPGEYPLPQRRGRMFFVGMFELRCVYNAIVRSQERKANGNGGCDAER